MVIPVYPPNTVVLRWYEKKYENKILPVWVFGISCGLSCNGIFENLPAINFLLNCSTCDQPVYHNILVLSDPKHSVHSLSVCRWIPTWIIYEINHENRCHDLVVAFLVKSLYGLFVLEFNTISTVNIISWQSVMHLCVSWLSHIST